MSDGKVLEAGNIVEDLVSVAFVGSREFPFLFMIEEIMDRVGRCTVISGGARGVDRVAETAANALGYPKIILKADWDKHGKAAGPIRNGEMVKLAQAAMVFWDGQSRGTQDFIRKAKKKKIPMVIFESGGNPPQINIHTYRMEMPGEQGQLEIPSITKAVAEGRETGATGAEKEGSG